MNIHIHYIYIYIYILYTRSNNVLILLLPGPPASRYTLVIRFNLDVAVYASLCMHTRLHLGTHMI